MQFATLSKLMNYYVLYICLTTYSRSIPPPFYFLTQDILVLFAHKRVPMDSCAWHWKFCRYRMFLVNLWIFWLDNEFSVTLWKCIGVRNARVWGNLVARCNRLAVKGLGTKQGLGFNPMRELRLFLCPTLVMKRGTNFSFFHDRAQHLQRYVFKQVAF